MTLAYWCIFITIFLPILCAAYAKRLGGFTMADNHEPRAFLANLSGKAARMQRSVTAMKSSRHLLPPSSSRTQQAGRRKASSTSGRCSLSPAASPSSSAISTTRCWRARCFSASTCSASSLFSSPPHEPHLHRQPAQRPCAPLARR